MKEEIRRILEKSSRGGADTLMPVLQEIQAIEGYLSPEIISEVSKYMGIAENRIYSIASFYDQFSFVPRGHKHIRVCLGTACHVNGSEAVVQEINKQLGIKAGQKTKDGWFSLEVVQCMGACSLGPVVEIDGKHYDHINPEKIRNIIAALREEGEEI